MSGVEDFDLGAVSGGESDSSSHYEPEDIQVLSTAQLGSNVSELRDALKDSQLKQQSLVHRHKALQTKYDALKASKSAAATRKNGCKSLLTSNVNDIALAGGRFFFVFELWVDGPNLECERPSGMDPLNSQHYADGCSEVIAIAAELYSSLPPNLQEGLADPRWRPSFKKIFLQCTMSERGTAVHAACNITGELFGVSPVFFCSCFAGRASIPELQRLIRDPTKQAEDYPLWAPMLFPDRNCEGENRLAVEELAKYLKSVLLGASLLNGDPAGRHTLRSQLWGITKTTPGMIALAATVVQRVDLHISLPPAELHVTQLMFLGGVTRVNWKDCFRLYKQTILRMPPQYYNFLLAWYNIRIFGPTSIASAPMDPPSLQQQGADDIDDLIRRMTANVDIGRPLSAVSIAQDR
ncbi:hypothetical protein V8E53_004725 [Lactarius tabidus]